MMFFFLFRKKNEKVSFFEFEKYDRKNSTLTLFNAPTPWKFNLIVDI